MKSIITPITICILSIFSFLTLSAQNKENGLLWKVSGNGLERPSYLLGTHHFVQVSFFDSIPGFKSAMEDTGQTVGELLMSDQPAMQVRIQQEGLMPDSITYSQLLSPDEYAILDEKLKNLLPVGLDKLGKLRPGMLTMFITARMFKKYDSGFDPMTHESIDAYVQRTAIESGKPVIGLETIDDQVYALLHAVPLKEHAEHLVCMMTHYDDEEEMKAMKIRLACYKTGDLSRMYDLTYNNPDNLCQTFSKVHENVFMETRTEKWANQLPRIMKDKPSLIAVGALHLVGENGFIARLIRQGYTVEAVK